MENGVLISPFSAEWQMVESTKVVGTGQGPISVLSLRTIKCRVSFLAGRVAERSVGGAILLTENRANTQK